MPVLHRLMLLALAGLGAVVFAAPSFAARPALPFTLQSPNFAVHYQSDFVNSSIYAITQATAGDIAALAERARAAEIADGYPAPPSDVALGGDARTDIYVEDLSAGGALGLTIPDSPASTQTSSYIVLAGDKPELAFGQHTIAHEVFHVIQLGIWFPQQLSDYWLLEGSAEWMGFRADAYDPAFGLDLGPLDMSLDCRDQLGTNQCDLLDDYANNGYSRWAFFEYLSETYGPSFVKSVFDQGAAGAPSMTAINAVGNALAAKGTTLANTYNAWTLFDLLGSYTPTALQGLPVFTYKTLLTGLKAGTLPTVKVPVNHLSTRIVSFRRGDGDPASTTKACYAATLSLTVAMPAGTQSKPVFWWNAKGNAPIALSISGNNAFAAIPWDTCTWAANTGYLSLPNASQTVDAADFVITSTLAVDTSQPISVIDPPAAYTVNGTVVVVDNGESAPTMSVAGSALLRMGAKDRVLRLLVESSGDGKLHAMLGGVDLGSPTLRAGNNDVRFTLPVSVRTALRRSSASDVLILTAFSPHGTKIGASVTRHVVLPTAVKKVVKTVKKVPQPLKTKLHRS